MSFRFILKILIGITLQFIIFPLIAVQINNYFDWFVLTSIYIKILGIILISMGVVTIVITLRDLFITPNQEMISPKEAPPIFISAGIMRYVRNPMYLGYFTVVLGEFFLFGHIALLGYFIIFITLVHIAVVNMEEPSLEKSFGNEYIAYKSTVPRWIPKLKKN